MNNTLILVHVISRHGDKTTTFSTIYPKDPHRENKFYPYGVGALTNEGKRTMYTLGKRYRERYNDYLGEIYLPEYVETWTTEIMRTRTSAQLLLTALYPPKGILKWNDDLEWQPIHTNYLPLSSDELLGAMVGSKRFMDTYTKVYDTEFGKKVLEKYQDIIPYIEEHSGLKIISTRKLFSIRDCLQTQSEFGLQIPEWSKLVYPERLFEGSYEEIRMEICTKELKRITCGLLFKKILTDTKNKINQVSNYKLHLYVGHDVNIAQILIILGLMDNHLPEYGASLTFEVHKINERYGIKIFYKKDKNSDFELMTLNNGQTVWWLEELEELVNYLWSDDVDNGDI